MSLRISTVILLLLIALSGFSQNENHKTENVVLVTFDGFRWQEVFTGANKRFIRKTKIVKDTAQLVKDFWANTPQERREKLLPFFWSTIAKQGQLYGNRKLGSWVDVKNIYRFSYPGYSEIFCGHPYLKINSNNYPDNPYTNIFDFINSQPGYKGHVAAFATWNAFPRIINSKRSGVPVFVEVQKDGQGAKSGDLTFDQWTTTCPPGDPLVDQDTLTYHFAKEYMSRYHPRFTFIGFDETDEAAHEGKYDSYLHSAHQFDEFLKDLWVFIQNDPQYRDKTTLMVTCDHGRGKISSLLWRIHGMGIVNARHTWIAAMGPDTKPLGEIKSNRQYYQNQIAQTIAHLLGMNYNLHPNVGKAIKGITGETRKTKRPGVH